MTQNKGDNWVRFFQVDEPKKHKNGFTIYKVTSVVFPKNAPEAVTNIVVWKRYNDFKKLHSNLKIHHKNCNISEELPRLSRVKYFKRPEEDIIQERIKCTLDLLNFIGRHPPLFTCVPFLQFFNNGYQVSDTISDYEISSITNGNESYSSSAFYNTSYMDKSSLNGDTKKDDTFHDDSNLNDSDNSYVHYVSSEDESFSISEGTEILPPESIPNAESKDEISLDCYRDSEGRRTLEGADIKNKKRSADEGSRSSMAQAHRSLSDESVAGETVTCRTEEPIKSSEMWLCIDPEDAGLPSRRSESSYPGKPIIAADGYLVEAGYHIGQAQKCEVAGEYESAFGFYKAAVVSLLSGISEDECGERRSLVQEKIKRYCQRAENVYSLHLTKKKDEEKKEKMLSCSEGLKVYKVLSIIDKVLLVLNTEENKRYVIKVLEKSPCPVDLKKKTIIPYNVPYMVKLVRYFENENSIFLVLPYVPSGKLWDYVDRCFQSCREPVRNGNEVDLPEHEAVEEASETAADEKREKSYFGMLRDYTAYTAKRVLGYNENEAVEVEPCDTARREDQLESPYENGGNLEVTDLVKNSQKLLESIKNTLKQSDFVTDKLMKNLDIIETTLKMEKEDNESGEKVLLDCKSKKRSRSVARSRFERRFSSEDVLESRSRTASNSLDRSGQWSRLATMLESTPVLSEATIREWAAEMFVAVETLHRWGITCRDLHPGNVLLDENGHLLLTFQLCWRGVDTSVSEEAVSGLYAAPETTKIFPVTPAADWWSYGALLFQLLTGKSLSSCYPGGILSHTIITFPEFLSPEACSLLTELLRYDPSERLGGGVNGSDDIKCHPFFSSVDWQLVYENL